MGTDKPKEEDFDAREIAKRRDDALRRALNTPPKPHGKSAKSKKENAPKRKSSDHHVKSNKDDPA